MGGPDVPPSVADVVRARVRQHSPAAQRILAAAAVLGRPSPAALLAAIAGVPPAAIDECHESGTLLQDDGAFVFRHELTRRAVEAGVPHVQATELHRIALLALEQDGADAAELAHHAVGAGDVDAIVRYAVPAGHTAAGASAHREAIVQFRRALQYADRLAPEEHADVLEALAQSLSARDQWAEAEEPWRQVVSLRRRLHDPIALSRCLRPYGMCLLKLCRTEEFLAARDESFELMRDADDCAERALSLFFRANAMDLSTAERRSLLDECARIAKDLDDHALIGRAQLGRAFLDGQSGVVDVELLEEALEHALCAPDAQLASAAYTNLLDNSFYTLRLDACSDRYDEALTYALEHEQHTYSLCIRGTRVLELGRRGANKEALELGLVTLEETMSPLNRMYFLIGLTRAGFRLGRPEARGWLDELWSLVRQNDETIWLVMTATVAAEAAWSSGDPGLVTDEVLAIYRRGLEDDPWVQGDLMAWLVRLGHPVDLDHELPAPYALEVAGDHAAAARAWHQLGCPFEEAVARASTGDLDEMRRALEILGSLGAEPAAGRVRRQLREQGVRAALPRGPRRTTRAHPAGLTAREAEVLDHVAGGLTNAQVAARLSLSTRTVDHHVSAILAKFGVESRDEAVAHLSSLSG
jgi:DNA-binding CsgD family transcriptional regulator/tetratricopeptide (TPR) repeat protein